MSVTHAVSLYVHDTIMKKCDKAISESSSVVEGKLVQQELEKKLLSLLEYSNREARRIFKSLGYEKEKDVFTVNLNKIMARTDNYSVRYAEAVKDDFRRQANDQYRKIIFDLDFMDNYTKEDVERMLDNVKFEI